MSHDVSHDSTAGQIPVRDAPDGQSWPSLTEALTGSKADVLTAASGRPVAYRLDGEWQVDEAALLHEAADVWWNSRIDAQRAALRVLRVQHSSEAVPVADVLAAAAGLGLANLPALSSLDEGRVWPSGQEWIAETGAEPDVRAVGEGMYPSWAAAVQATHDAIETARDNLAARLKAAPGLAARLAATRHRWASPQLNIWASTDQTAAWRLRS